VGSLNLKRARTYAERMFRHVIIGHLEREDAWGALGIPLSGSGRTFDLSLVGEIVERTAGYPYFLQFVRHEVACDPGGLEEPTGVLSQQDAEAEGSSTLEAQGRAGAALTTTDRIGTARRSGSGKQDGQA
jgi:hypothetical protein